MGKVLMVQGTASSVGKSLMVAALCRIYARRGLKVAPFKAQNMSNNAAVTADGGEIGRAQALQAAAAGIEPTVEMNPVLLKPASDSSSQVIVLGRPWVTLPAGEFYLNKERLWRVVTASLDRLRETYDLVIIEGAGSAAELNLRQGDIVNMAVAKYANAPVALVGDIDRGGIFAQLLGTLLLLPPEERSLVRWLVVNKFRGDEELFADGIQILVEKSSRPVLGVVPYIHDLRLPEEDAANLDEPQHVGCGEVMIAVIRLPHIANFDDFDVLASEPGVSVRFVNSPDRLLQESAVVIPGTKSTIFDLEWMRSHGIAKAIKDFLNRGGSVVGICGGYQMLGEAILDPTHVESRKGHVLGLGLLPGVTTFVSSKESHLAEAVVRKEAPGWAGGLAGQRVRGYEIHSGRTFGDTPWLTIVRRGRNEVDQMDGGMNRGGRVWGTYLHGIFGNVALRRAWLRSLGWVGGDTPGYSLEAELDRLAEHFEEHLNMQMLDSVLRGG